MRGGSAEKYETWGGAARGDHKQAALPKLLRSEDEILLIWESTPTQLPERGGVKSSSCGWVGGTRLPSLASWMWRAMQFEMQRPSF